MLDLGISWGKKIFRLLGEIRLKVYFKIQFWTTSDEFTTNTYFKIESSI